MSLLQFNLDKTPPAKTDIESYKRTFNSMCYLCFFIYIFCFLCFMTLIVSVSEILEITLKLNGATKDKTSLLAITQFVLALLLPWIYTFFIYKKNKNTTSFYVQNKISINIFNILFKLSKDKKKDIELWDSKIGDEKVRKYIKNLKLIKRDATLVEYKMIKNYLLKINKEEKNV